MSYNPVTDYTVEEIVEEDEFSADDFCFIIGPEGELKSMVIPEHLMEDPPEEVQVILRIFGIENINQLEDRILH